MSTCSSKLNGLKDVTRFVNTAGRCPCALQLVSGRYKIDAKSLMGVLSLDLTRPVRLEVQNGDSAQFFDEIAPYVVA